MSRFKPLSIFSYWWERRFSPLEEAGYATSRGAVTRTEKIIGLSMVAVGFYLRKRRRHSKLYSHTVKPGETVRINVFRGSESIANTTVGS